MSVQIHRHNDTPGIIFSLHAADKVAALLQEEKNPLLNLRIYITGGGCSGFQYGFTFDDKIHDDDTVVEKTSSDGKTQVKLVVDSMSYQYLKNAEIDYTQGIQGEQFIIRNPNAKTTCGCGSSFSIDDDEMEDMEGLGGVKESDAEDEKGI